MSLNRWKHRSENYNGKNAKKKERRESEVKKEEDWFE